MKKSYNEWKTTNPADEELGPDPKAEMNDDAWEENANLWRGRCEERDAEIARLKAADSVKESAIRDLCEIAREKDQLITDLASAASLYLSLDGSEKIYDAVKLQGARVKVREEIQRARDVAI